MLLNIFLGFCAFWRTASRRPSVFIIVIGVLLASGYGGWLFGDHYLLVTYYATVSTSAGTLDKLTEYACLTTTVTIALFFGACLLYLLRRNLLKLYGLTAGQRIKANDKVDRYFDRITYVSAGVAVLFIGEVGYLFF